MKQKRARKAAATPAASPPAPPPVVPLPDDSSEAVRRQLRQAQRTVAQRQGYSSSLLSGGDRTTVSAPGKTLLGQ